MRRSLTNRLIGGMWFLVAALCAGFWIFVGSLIWGWAYTTLDHIDTPPAMERR